LVYVKLLRTISFRLHKKDDKPDHREILKGLNATFYDYAGGFQKNI
jgi:hypothetical protein